MPADDKPLRWLPHRRDQATMAAVMVVLLIAWALVDAWRVRDGSWEHVDRVEQRDFRFHLNVNRAEWPELTLLPQIGETLARRIVDSREHEGPFESVEQLARVKGIGPMTLKQIRPFVTPMAPPRAEGR